MTPHLTKLECPFGYLNYNLLPLNLETCTLEEFGDSKINLAPFFSKHQIRRIHFNFVRANKDDEIVCGGQSLDQSVGDLILENADCTPIHLPNHLIHLYPNLQRVFFFFDVLFRNDHFGDKVSAMVEGAREHVQRSSNVRYIFDVCVDDSRYFRSDAFLGKLRDLGLLSDQMPSFVSIRNLEDDADIKLRPCYDYSDQVVTCSTGQIKFFFWYIRYEDAHCLIM
ncbi:hypothetical protein M3Y94_00015400 [Aphelenchoides besseyi]|nr:hypothetical protein M3Y94_00015400 [Aphelenchoides besseyi]